MNTLKKLLLLKCTLLCINTSIATPITSDELKNLTNEIYTKENGQSFLSQITSEMGTPTPRILTSSADQPNIVSFNSSTDTTITSIQLQQLQQLQPLCERKFITEATCELYKKAILESNLQTSNPVAHQQNESIDWFCNYAGENTKPLPFIAESQIGYSENTNANEIVREIIDASGLVPNFIVRPATVPNAAAIVRGSMRYIEYNPSFFSDLKSATKINWSIYSVMAHEIGHHLQGHTMQGGGSRPPIELEADEYSGFILRKLGANLDQALIAMNTISSEHSSSTHPGKSQRLQAITTGWNKANNLTSTPPIKTQSSQPPIKIQSSQPTQPTMPSVIYTDRCVIQNEEVFITQQGQVISPMRGNQQIAQRQQPFNPAQCIFDIVIPQGRYCVNQQGSVFYGNPYPVGTCQRMQVR